MASKEQIKTEENIKKEKQAIEKSFIVDCGKDGIVLEQDELKENKWKRIVEQVYDERNGPRFCVYDLENNKVDGYFYQHWVGGECFKPICGEDVTKKVVLLPSEAVDYESEEVLANDVEKFIRKWAGLSEQFYKVATWYILTSWVYDRYDTINYLRALGDTGSGKSRFIDTIGGLCYKFIKISGAASPAAAFRIHEKWKGTIAIEEGDLKESDETNDIVKWLNCGFERNNPIIRCDKNDPKKLDYFDPFGPKIIATRREFQDTATEARCLTEKMIQDSSKPDTKTDEFYEERSRLRNQLLMFRFKNYFKVDIKKVLDFDLTSLEPRLRQASRPFLALVWDKPKLLEEFKHFLEDYNKEIVEIRANSYVGQIVNSIADFILEGQEIITCQDIKEKLGIEKVTAKSIGKQLRTLKLKLVPKKVDGKTKKIVELDKEILSIVFKRYIVEVEILQELAQKSYQVTEVTEHIGTNEIGNQAKVTDFTPQHSVGNLGNSVTEEVVQESPEDLILAFIKARQNDTEPNGSLILKALEQLGENWSLITKLLKNGQIMESRRDHYRILE